MANTFTRRHLLLSAPLAATLVACGQRHSATDADGTLKVLLRGNGPDPDSLDPHKARSMEATVVLRDPKAHATRSQCRPIPGEAHALDDADGLSPPAPHQVVEWRAGGGDSPPAAPS
jgi:hypothetical protein